jgi:hypothetical protein
MPQFKIRCNTERVLHVEAADEAAAREIAEHTDFSAWTSTDSPYSIEEPNASVAGTMDGSEPQQVVEIHSDTLRIDLQLFRGQRELLTKIADLAGKNQPYTPEAGDEQLLDGLLELTDALFDTTEASGR